MGANASSELSKVNGFQIGRVLPNSPAHIAGLCPFFDIITGVDDIALDLDSVDFFKDYVSRNVNTTVRLTLFNLRVRVYRVVDIAPSDSWGGIGLLGCAMEWSSAAAALELTWHIEGIDPQGPAGSCADLKAGRDYIVGMQAPDEPVVTLFTHSTFAEKMEGWRALRRTNTEMDQGERETLLLLVFDSEANVVKEVPVFMGNNTSLGVEIADGYLHFVPEVTIKDPSEVADNLPHISKFVVNGSSQVISSQPKAVAAPDEASLSPPPPPPPAAPVQSSPTVAVPSPQPLPTQPHTPPKAPSFQSFLPTPGNGAATGPNTVAYPGGLPFPSFPMPPSVRPPQPAVVPQPVQ